MAQIKSNIQLRHKQFLSLKFLLCTTCSVFYSYFSSTMKELLGLEGADVDSKDSGIEEGREEDSGDVLWDLHDEQEQIESYQQACSSTNTQLGFQKVDQILALCTYHIIFFASSNLCYM